MERLVEKNQGMLRQVKKIGGEIGPTNLFAVRQGSHVVDVYLILDDVDSISLDVEGKWALMATDLLSSGKSNRKARSVRIWIQERLERVCGLPCRHRHSGA